MGEKRSAGRGARAIRRVGAALAMVVAAGGLTGCHQWSGGKMVAEERAHVLPGKVLEFETEQRGTVVRLTNEGDAPLTIAYPPESGQSWALAPGDTWRHRLRQEKIVEIANRGTEPTKLGVWIKARNFALEYDLREQGTPGNPTRITPD